MRKAIPQVKLSHNAYGVAVAEAYGETEERHLPLSISARQKASHGYEMLLVDKIRDIVSKFEDKDIVESIKEEDNGINIYIGSENDFDDDVTVIKTKYQVNGEEGTIALIGPKRMEYDRVITLLNYIMENIEK